MNRSVARWTTLALGVLCAVSGVVRAQTRPNPEYPGTPSAPSAPSAQRFETTSTAIVVDVVVRDSKGALITDLTADQF
ncbi:MAG: hypothetical protein ACR2LU_09360, partial [Luteitalea sp.]